MEICTRPQGGGPASEVAHPPSLGAVSLGPFLATVRAKIDISRLSWRTFKWKRSSRSDCSIDIISPREGLPSARASMDQVSDVSQSETPDNWENWMPYAF